MRFLFALVKSNLQRAFEYKTSLISQAVGMLLTDVMWVVFFAGYFDRFQIPGWGQKQVIALWAFTATSYGLAGVFTGNFVKVASVIMRGELDFYLALPKPVLPHMLMSEARLVSAGDLVFGVVTTALFLRPSFDQWLLYILGAICGAVVLISFNVIGGSLAFWLANAETINEQLFNAVTQFSTYPLFIHEGFARLVMFTVIPAAFISALPVEMLTGPSSQTLALMLTGTTAFLALAIITFHLGLKRYTSGSLLLVRD
jgi:ABC-2 type transport system permease protein